MYSLKRNKKEFIKNNNLVLKIHQRLKSERHNVFNEKINEISLSSNGFTKKNIKEHNPNLLQILDHPYKILIIGGSGSGKTNSLLNIMIHQSDILNNKNLI